MKRVSQRTGQSYSEGSHSTWDGYPRVCAAGCGRPLRVTRDVVWMETTESGERLSWHMECRLARSGVA